MCKKCHLYVKIEEIFYLCHNLPVTKPCLKYWQIPKSKFILTCYLYEDGGKLYTYMKYLILHVTRKWIGCGYLLVSLSMQVLAMCFC